MSIRSLCFLIITCLMTTLTNAQPGIDWTQTFGREGTEECKAMIQTDDDGFALAGRSDSFGMGRSAFYLVKTNERGEERWSRTYGDERDATCSDIIQTEDGGYVLAGTKGLGTEEMCFRVIRTDGFGEVLWSGEYDLGSTCNCLSICQSNNDGFLLAGWTNGFGEENMDAVVLKISVNGDSLWSRTWDGEEMDYFSNVERTSDGGYLLVGATGSFRGDILSGHVVKLDSEFEEEQSNTFVHNPYNSFNSCIEISRGGYVFAGSTGDHVEDIYDCLLIRTDLESDMSWRREFGGGETDIGLSITETNDRCYLLAGESNSYSGLDNSDIYLVKCDDSGREVWSGTYGGEGYEGSPSVVQLENGCFVMAGTTESFGEGNRDMWLVKTGPDPLLIQGRNEPASPDKYNILSAHPNPFNLQTTISFTLPIASQVSLTVHNDLGQSVATLVNGMSLSGKNEIVWDAKGISAGTYFIRLGDGNGIIGGQRIVLQK